MRLVPHPLLLLSLAAPLGAQDAASPFDARRIVPRSDSFVVIVQGRQVGGIRETLERTRTGYRLVSTQAMAGMSQSTEVLFSPALVMTSVKQSGQARGQAMRIEVAYAKGRTQGNATTPGPQGMKTITVDTIVPPGVVDDNALQSLLHALPLGEGKAFTIPVFASGQGTSTLMTLKVAGAESVTVPAGTFDTWKVEVSGGPVPVSFWISRADPRVVKLGFGGAPMSFELAK